MKILRQIIRGCLPPYGGKHPSTMFTVALIVLGAVAGARDGWISAVVGATMMCLFFIPVYLIVAYDRAQLSDLLSHARSEVTKLPVPVIEVNNEDSN